MISIPFPSHRLAQIALRSLSVDEELSPLVRRDIALSVNSSKTITDQEQRLAPSQSDYGTLTAPASQLNFSAEDHIILKVDYRATTPRMLRVAVNGFFESLSLISQIMEELDVDVLHEKGIEGLEGVQGVEQGLTGTAVGVGG